MPIFADDAMENVTGLLSDGGQYVLAGVPDVETWKEARLCANIAKLFALLGKACDEIEKTRHTVDNLNLRLELLDFNALLSFYFREVLRDFRRIVGAEAIEPVWGEDAEPIEDAQPRWNDGDIHMDVESVGLAYLPVD